MSPGRRAAREDLPVGVSPTPPLAEPRVARRTATRFVLALLRRELAPNRPAPARAISAAATAGLARLVLAGRPRTTAAGARPVPARLIELELTGSWRGHATAVASIRRGPATAALVLRLVHRGGRWRVGGLR